MLVFLSTLLLRKSHTWNRSISQTYDRRICKRFNISYGDKHFCKVIKWRSISSLQRGFRVPQEPLATVGNKAIVNTLHNLASGNNFRNSTKNGFDRRDFFLDSLKNACLYGDFDIGEILVQDNCHEIHDMNSLQVCRLLIYLIWIARNKKDSVKVEEYTNCMLGFRPKSVKNLKTVFNVALYYHDQGNKDGVFRLISYFHDHFFVHMDYIDQSLSVKHAKTRLFILLKSIGVTWSVLEGEKFVLMLKEFGMLNTTLSGELWVWSHFLNGYMKTGKTDTVMLAEKVVFDHTKRRMYIKSIFNFLIKHKEEEKLEKYLTELLSDVHVSAKRRFFIELNLVYAFITNGEMEQAITITRMLPKHITHANEMKSLYEFLITCTPYNLQALDKFTEILVKQCGERVLDILTDVLKDCFRNAQKNIRLLEEFMNYMNHQENKEKAIYSCLVKTMDKCKVTKESVLVYMRSVDAVKSSSLELEL